MRKGSASTVPPPAPAGRRSPEPPGPCERPRRPPSPRQQHACGGDVAASVGRGGGVKRKCLAHRSHEASSTIHETSSPKETPACAAISGTRDVSVMPGWVLTSRQTNSPDSPFDSSYLKSARLTPRQPSARCATKLNLWTSW